MEDDKLFGGRDILSDKPITIEELLDDLDNLKKQLTGLPLVRKQKVSELLDDFQEWSKELLKDELKILKFTIELQETVGKDPIDLKKKYANLLRQRKLNRICKK